MRTYTPDVSFLFLSFIRSPFDVICVFSQSFDKIFGLFCDHLTKLSVISRSFDEIYCLFPDSFTKFAFFEFIWRNSLFWYPQTNFDALVFKKRNSCKNIYRHTIHSWLISIKRVFYQEVCFTHKIFFPCVPSFLKFQFSE